MPNATTPRSNTTDHKSTLKSAQTPGSEGSAADNAGKPGFENEGEGNKTAARHYNKATEEYSKSGRAGAAASAAKEALDGPEGEELREAEEEGKKGEPKTDGASRS